MTFRILTESGDRILLENGSDFLRSETAATPFAGFKMTGPDCCCCRDIWSQQASLIEIKKDSIATRYSLTGIVAGLDYEAKKAALTGTDGDGTHRVYISNTQEPFDLLTLAGADASIVWPPHACIDRVNQHVYYSKNFGALDQRMKMRRVDYDGSNDTEIGEFHYDVEGMFNYAGTIMWIVYNRVDGYIYYLRKRDSGTPTNKKFQIWRIKNDGTDDTMLYECIHDYEGTGTAPVYIDDISSLSLDYDNNRVWFCESIRTSTTSATQNRKLHSMSGDGTDDDVVIDRAFTTATATASDAEFMWAQWSHRDSRVITYEFRGSQATDAFGGIIAYDSAGGNREIILAREHFVDAIFPRFHLWCGFEKTGTGTEA